MNFSLGNEPSPQPGIPAPRGLSRFIGVLGVAGTAVALAAFPFSRELAAVGKQLMIGAFLFGLAVGHTRGLVRRPLFLLFLGWAGYLLAATILASRQDLWAGHEPWQKAERWLLLGLIPLAAWWIGDRRFGRRLWLLALFGFVAYLLVLAPPGSWQKGFSGMRVDFGLNPQHAALYFATVLVFLIGLRREWVAHSRPIVRLALWCCWIFLVLAALYGSIVTQTRGVWLALLLAALAALAARWCIRCLELPRPRRAFALVALALMLGGSLLLYGYDIVRARLDGPRQDIQVVEQVVEGSYEQIAAISSFGIRFHLWQWAFEKWTERPWMGWGVRAVIPLSRAEQKAELRGFEHLHNSWLEIMVGTGVIGLLVFLAFFGRLTLDMWRGTNRGGVRGHEFVLFIAVLVLVAVANLTEAHITKHYFWLYLAAVFGPFAALTIRAPGE